MSDIESNSTFEETVLCTVEQLSVLPNNILEIIALYQEGKLTPVTKEEVTKSLSNWFNNKHGTTCECSHSTNDVNVRFEIGEQCKRQRFNSNV